MGENDPPSTMKRTLLQRCSVLVGSHLARETTAAAPVKLLPLLRSMAARASRFSRSRPRLASGIAAFVLSGAGDITAQRIEQREAGQKQVSSQNSTGTAALEDQSKPISM